MKNLLKHYRSLFILDRNKLDIPKFILQFIVMLIPLYIGYFLGNINMGLLISVGALSNIYVFGGTLQSKLKTIVIVTLIFAFATILGTLTAGHYVLFGILTLFFSVIPYYVCNVLKIKGPSSTFIIVAYGLASIMPHAPSDTKLAQYLLVLENIAKHFETGESISFISLSPLVRQKPIFNIVMDLQYRCMSRE
ncbi:hypothetical protein [Macrococcoides caseolyticum]|uniref:hypothetical protein n=1 Tax=Macrococcoides caseolyticum TaxID=69966 RepID=UPI001F2DFEFB|nr:hypothetical protein [Macrococcus caseolyticus]MCE4956645.1 hypothetical protein [Macrococcus caseolyticus]